MKKIALMALMASVAVTVASASTEAVNVEKVKQEMFEKVAKEKDPQKKLATAQEVNQELKKLSIKDNGSLEAQKKVKVKVNKEAEYAKIAKIKDENEKLKKAQEINRKLKSAN